MRNYPLLVADLILKLQQLQLQGLLTPSREGGDRVDFGCKSKFAWPLDDRSKWVPEPSVDIH